MGKNDEFVAKVQQLLEHGFFSETNIRLFEQRKIEAYIATGRQAHPADLNTLLGTIPSAPQQTPAQKKKWRTNLLPKSGTPFIVYENVLSNLLLESSKKSWAFASFPWAA